MASNYKESKKAPPPQQPLWKHPEKKEEQREALFKYGFFTAWSKTFDPNSVRD
jgi:hypothetical protein